MFRLFSGVDIGTFHHVLRGPWSWFKEAFLRGNIFGGQGCLDMSEVTEVQMLNGKVNVKIERKDKGLILDLGSEAPRQKYPFVLCSVPKEVNENDDLKVGAVLNVIHVKDEVCRMPTQILSSHLKHFNGQTTTLEQIFVSKGHEEDEGQSLCSVCQDQKVSRVLFPCRHACVCKRCFSKIRKQCPMCRTKIQSFFKLRDDINCQESEDEVEIVPESSFEEQEVTWGQRLREWNHRYAMAMGLRDNEALD